MRRWWEARTCTAKCATSAITIEAASPNENTSVTNMVEYLVAEVISKFLPHRWDFDPPVLVLEHYPPRRSSRVPERTAGQPDYDVVTFDSWRPTTIWQAGIKRIRLGEPAWHHLLTDEVAALIGESEVNR